MTTTPGLVAGILVAVVVWFAVLWIAICFLVASVSGWRRLRRLYASDSFAGPTTRTPGYVGRSRFRGRALIAGATPTGLHLNVAAPFRVGAGPVLIPWSEIEGPAPSPGLASFVTLDFPEARTSLRIPEEVAGRLLAWKR